MGVLSKLVKVAGWTPLGRSIEIEIEEAGDESLVGKKLNGQLGQISSDGSALVELVDSLLGITSVVATPRHRGFDWYRLPFGTIAVWLTAQTPSTQSSQLDGRFASGLARLC